MKTDRELLELAAKAAGNVQGMYMEWNEAGTKQFGITTATGMRWWNPLRDDGDALRLAVTLCVDFKNYGKTVRTWVGDTVEQRVIASIEELSGSDPYAATRRAIVRAAAEIGEAMK